MHGRGSVRMMGEVAKSIDVIAFTGIRSVAKFIVVSLTAFMRVWDDEI